MVYLSAVYVATLEEQKIIICTDNRLGIRIYSELSAVLQTGIISRYEYGENTIVEKLNQGMHLIGYQDWQILSLVLLVKVDWIQDVLHSLTTAFHQQFVLPPVSLACDVTAIAENPAQIN